MSYSQSNAIVNIPNTGLTATTTTVNLSVADGGKVILLNRNSAAGGTAVLAINLPVLASSVGVRYKFIIASGTPITTNDITISTAAATACLRSVVSGNVTASTGGNAAARTTLTIVCVTGGATGCAIGDTIDAFCDGTHWYLASNVNLVGAVTIA
jgi:hypothetical protein